jgi:hypothetical protein
MKQGKQLILRHKYIGVTLMERIAGAAFPADVERPDSPDAGITIASPLPDMGAAASMRSMMSATPVPEKRCQPTTKAPDLGKQGSSSKCRSLNQLQAVQRHFASAMWRGTPRIPLQDAR